MFYPKLMPVLILAGLILSGLAPLALGQENIAEPEVSEDMTLGQLEDLFARGVSLDTLAARGYDVKKLVSIGVSLDVLSNRGATIQQFLKAGLTIQDLFVLPLSKFHDEGVNSQVLLLAGKTIDELSQAGFSTRKIWEEGAPLELILDNIALKRIVADKIPIQDLLGAGASELDLLNAGAPLEEVVLHGDVNVLRKLFGDSLLREAGLTDAQIESGDIASETFDALGIDGETLVKLNGLNLKGMREEYNRYLQIANSGDDETFVDGKDLDELLEAQFKTIQAAGLKLIQVFPFFGKNHLLGLMEARRQVLAQDQNQEEAKAKNEANLNADANAVAAKVDENLAFGNEIKGTLENFSSLFNGFIDGVSTANNNLSGVIDFKVPVKGMKFKAVISEPKLYEPIRTALGEENAEAADSLESGLDDLDSDVVFTLSWSYNSEKIGRNAKFINRYLGGVMLAEQEDPALDDAINTIANLLSEARRKNSKISGDEPLIQWGMDRVSLLKLYDNFIIWDDAHVKSDLAWGALKSRYHFDEMMELASNQPQFFISGSYRSADSLVGPDNYALSATYEYGFFNLNSLRKKIPGLNNDLDSGALSADSLDSMMGSIQDNRRKIKMNPRLAIKAEYKRVRGYEYAMDGVSIMEDDTYDWNLSLAYGLNILEPNSQNTAGRLDFSLTREGSNNDLKVERTLITASYTRKLVGDSWSVPIALVYANKPEFLDGLVDDNITARIGFRYKQPVNTQ